MLSFWLPWDSVRVWAGGIFVAASGYFLQNNGFIAEGNGHHWCKLLAVSLPSCILGVVLRFSGSCSLSMFLTPFNSLININVLYQILFCLSQVDREVSVFLTGSGQKLSLSEEMEIEKYNRPKIFLEVFLGPCYIHVMLIFHLGKKQYTTSTP